jgi:hypothetical protein
MRRLYNQFLEAKYCCSLVPKNKIASIALCAIYCAIILQDVFGGVVTPMLLEYSTVAADNFHLQLARLNLPVLPVAESRK